ncbi:hypothetical protein SAMN06297144_1430 [Sphingomonas guangdongensis]|uniref:Uncharacterized protein n=1 Tax=Sphingomonas guangdongensis TaxID=1141890 RepID=A0A285QM44_9SPHN|nr:hypothetical protein [Sphingomonas guangdongensis]SOB81162.1 hypothetical protein SAMN06297144_1430 [Sphingomonas guangdongensis]
MNLGKLLKSVAKKAKENPELALIVLGIAAPKLAAKVAPKIAQVAAAVKVAKAL